jgi:uncharacterized Zn finger protein
MGYYGWPKYISVAERKRKAEKKAAELIKKGKKLEPINIEGRTIAKTYWGRSWCENLESYSDYANRLPRGRTYVRNGFVIDLKITPGSIEALVGGSSTYNIKIDIAALSKDKWQAIVKECSGKIDSIIELLSGKFSKSIMEVIARKDQGLFPQPNEIKISCSCPDYADVCKHVAAVFYGVGVRLDTSPELLFTLRQVDHNELITASNALETLADLGTEQQAFADDELSNIFGIDIGATKSDDNIETISGKITKTKTKCINKIEKSHKINKVKKIVKVSKLVVIKTDKPKVLKIQKIKQIAKPSKAKVIDKLVKVKAASKAIKKSTKVVKKAVKVIKKPKILLAKTKPKPQKRSVVKIISKKKNKF